MRTTTSVPETPTVAKPAVDPFGLALSADTLCPLCGLPLGPHDGSVHLRCADYENNRDDIEQPADPWPPEDKDQLAELEAWMDEREEQFLAEQRY